MKTIFVVMDSLNRHYLSAYGGSQVQTPNIDRLASRGTVFDNHYCGSLPCMPARREMMTGRHNFLEAPWGPIEPWDDCLPTLLREAKGTYSHLITDHYHYFHSGGEAYHTLFDSYEFERGQENDRWRPVVDPPALPERLEARGRRVHPYWANFTSMDPEADESYSTPRCFMRAIDFLERNHASDNWHLHVEAFDPHEPFDCPTRYREMYEDGWTGGHYSWPEYGPVDPALDDDRSIAHIRASYAGSVMMADHWLGRLLDTLDRHDLWKEVTLVFTTDHGHLLGEHGYWAKNVMFDYEELTHIPLIAAHPGMKGGGRGSPITTTVDLAPTFLDLHGVPVPETMHGRSMARILAEPQGAGLYSLREGVLYGYFGKDIGLFDGRYTYCRQPLPGSIVHHHTAMPRGIWDFVDQELLAAAETGTFLEHTHGIPHFRIAVPSRRHHNAPDFNPIYDLRSDPGQTNPIRDAELEEELAEKMRRLLVHFNAPPCQAERTGLA